MKPILVLAPLLLAALPCAPLEAQAPPAVRLEYEEETLPNGLKVIYSVDRSAPVASTVLWYDVGSKHEVRGRTGFAHLFEHLMLFTGSRNAPEGRHFGLLEAVGARAGSDINGTTSFDRTNYFQQVPSHALELALWLEADRMATLDEALNEGKLANQREVVKNERRQGMDNQPYGRWIERILVHMYPEEHPYRHVVLGSMEDLENASIEDVRSFFRTYYVPNNAVLAIAGDIDVPQVRQMVRRYFGGIPGGAEPPPVRRVPLPPRLGASPREVIPDANAPAPAVYVGFRVPPARDPRAPAVNLLAQLLAGGRSSPLYTSLVRDRQVATQVFSFNFELVEDADLLVVGATGKPGANADSLEAALLAEVHGVAARIDAAGLERARAAATFDLVNQLQAMGGFGGRGDVLAQGAVVYGDAGWINRYLPALGAVSVNDVSSLAREFLAPDNRAVLVFVPAPREGAPR
ncbi:MAG TPA: pitrilysin family protein [Longimicrobium sp.]|jgi:predicted Zn-dependent peptidase|uniref:M16 family metallopeptidase n=1 Tax=Longimicrobium sp. TaxID=2029185 RepID=UPI002EDB6ED0